MSKSTKLLYQNNTLDCLGGETVLDTLLRHQQPVSFSCRNGICHTCLLKCTSGIPGTDSQNGINPELCSKGYFLACKCKPGGDLSISPPNSEDLFIKATVQSKRFITKSVIRLLIQPEANILYQGGQFLNLRHPLGFVRNYSIASSFIQDPYLELHIQKIQHGKMTRWLFEDIQEQDHIEIQGPQGNCYYHLEDKSKNLLMIATGTGLAPLQGIIKDALSAGHRGEIHLYHGSRFFSGLYHSDFFKELQKTYSNFFYHPCASKESYKNAGITAIRADVAAFTKHRDLQNWGVFICGLPVMVHSAINTAHQLGANQADIYFEGFGNIDSGNAEFRSLD